MAIIGLGNALTDILVQIPDETILEHLGVRRGGMYLVDYDRHQQMMQMIASLPQTLAAGGSSANAMGGVARLGTPASFIGQVGRDETGEAFRSHQQQNRITPLLGVSETTPSGKCISMVLPDGERTMLTYLGAALELQAAHLTSDKMQGHRVLFVEGYLLNSPHVIEPALKLAREQGLEIAFDAASFTVIDEFREYADTLIDTYVDILFANEDEARALTGLSDPAAALEALAPRCRIVIVKVGPEGSMIARGEERCRIGTIPATPVDKTGAGDLYAAGFLHGYARGLDLRQCGDIGAIVSSKSIETIGARIPEETWPEIIRLTEAVAAGERIVQ